VLRRSSAREWPLPVPLEAGPANIRPTEFQLQGLAGIADVRPSAQQAQLSAPQQTNDPPSQSGDAGSHPIGAAQQLWWLWQVSDAAQKVVSQRLISWRVRAWLGRCGLSATGSPALVILTAPSALRASIHALGHLPRL